jgi:hypothetical protein
MSAPEERLRVLRDHVDREWHEINGLDTRRQRIIAWLVNRGWMENHPTSFLSLARITDVGYEVLAQAGGDVTGSGW